MSEKIRGKALLEIESLLPQISSKEEFEFLIQRFIKVDEDYCLNHKPQLFLQLWTVALQAGKIKLANRYAKFGLDYLVSLKRVPKIIELLSQMNKAGVLKKSEKEIKLILEILLGKKKSISAVELKYIEILSDHPEHWKTFPEFLQQYLLIEDFWTIEHWKYCYEYILLHHFDQEIFLALLEKAGEKKKKNVEKSFADLLTKKKIKFKTASIPEAVAPLESSAKLNLDYDQLAMEVISGAITLNDQEQKRVLNSLKFISEDELKTRGSDMVVAFELLGMEKVVIALSEKLVELLEDTKQKASVYFIWAQTLYNSENYYAAIDLVDKVLSTEPLYGDELIAFYYLKAESLFKLKKFQSAKDLFLKIKKVNNHYRLVTERLRAIETA